MGQMALIVTNPATEETIAELDPAGVEETDAAVARAKAAYKEWRAVAPTDRARSSAGTGDARRRTHGGARADRVAERRQADRGGPRRGRHGRAGLPLLRRRVDKHYGQTIPVAGGVT